MGPVSPADDPPKKKRTWLVYTPLVSLLTALAILVLHFQVMSNDADARLALAYEFALTPARFFAPAGSDIAYPGIFEQLASLVTTALLHNDWIHAGINALMCWQFGSQVARVLGPGIAGASKWMLLFLASVAAGSIAYLLIAGAGAPAAVGASGGTSGLIGASFLFDWEGRIRSPLNRSFLILTAVFAAINALLVYLGPQLLGMYVSWEAHAGGYVAGVAMMLIFGRKMTKAPAA